MRASIIAISLVFLQAALASLTVTADGYVNNRDASLQTTKKTWGPIVGGIATVNSILQGIRNALGVGSNDDESHKPQEEHASAVPYPPSNYAPSNPQAQNSSPYPQAQIEPQWENAPQSQSAKQRQPNPSPPDKPEESEESEVTFQDNDSSPRREEPKPSAKKPVGMSITLSSPVACRKYPDTVLSSSWPKNVYAGGSKLFINCWTAASMPDALGKIENSPIWLKTDRGCYISDTSTNDWVDFQAKLPFCLTPIHWAATARQEYETRLECYQCPSLKCPMFVMNKSKTVDVQCFVDGEDARGNSTWVKPVDQNCYLPGETFTNEGWLGTTGSKC